MNNLKVGQTLFWGKCKQYKNSDLTPIEWIVIFVDNNQALLLSKYGLIPSAYFDIGNEDCSSVDCEWNNSLVRKMCKEFFENAFSEKEKRMICLRQILNERSGDSCYDSVFLLSEQEVLQYLPEKEQRRCKGTEYVTSIIHNHMNGFYGWWILPKYEKGGKTISPNGVEYDGVIYPKAVLEDGKIFCHSRFFYYSNSFVIRPCICINLLNEKEG